MLEIKNLHASVNGKEILRGVNLKINAGEVHAIMGPNGSGKSTLAGVLAGREAYEVSEGTVTYVGKNLLDMSPEDRARSVRQLHHGERTLPHRYDRASDRHHHRDQVTVGSRCHALRPLPRCRLTTSMLLH